MVSLSRLFAPRRRKNQQEVACRAAEVVEKVLFDVGIDRFLNGSVLLDRQFRLRFVTIMPAATRDLLAAIALRDLAEATILRACMSDALLDRTAVTHHTAFLADGVMRELRDRCPALRALPLRREADVTHPA